MIVLSSIFVGMGWYFLQSVASGPVRQIPDDWQTPFQLGVVIAFMGGQVFFMSLFCLFSALYWFLARRKDELLVTYHRRLVELGELDESPSGNS